VGEAPTPFHVLDPKTPAVGTILESSRFGKVSVVPLVTIRLTLCWRDVFSNLPWRNRQSHDSPPPERVQSCDDRLPDVTKLQVKSS
jgi:hypothetical protein